MFSLSCRYPSLLAAVLLALMSHSSVLGQESDSACNGDFVSLEAGVLTVKPVGDGESDTINLQCAFDEATNKGFSSIRLVSGDYLLTDHIYVNEFFGSFSGVSMDKTSIETNANRIYLRSSKVEVSRMSLHSAPRINGAFFWIHPVEYDCSKRVVRTTFDRVRMQWIPESDEAYDPDNTFYIYQAPYWYCRDGALLGSLSVNRSQFSGADIGILVIGFGGGAKIDISNNTFWGGRALNLYGERGNYDNPLNANISFTGNTVTLVDGGSTAILLGSTDYGINSSTIHIARNRFIHDKVVFYPRESRLGGASIRVTHRMPPLLDDNYSMPITIVGNTFDRSAWLRNESTGEYYRVDKLVNVEGFNRGVISGNRFLCNFGEAVDVTGDSWAFSGNTLSACRRVEDGGPAIFELSGENNVEGGNTY